MKIIHIYVTISYEYKCSHRNLSSSTKNEEWTTRSASSKRTYQCTTLSASSASVCSLASFIISSKNLCKRHSKDSTSEYPQYKIEDEKLHRLPVSLMPFLVQTSVWHWKWSLFIFLSGLDRWWQWEGGGGGRARDQPSMEMRGWIGLLEMSVWPIHHA